MLLQLQGLDVVQRNGERAQKHDAEEATDDLNVDAAAEGDASDHKSANRGH